MKKKPLVSIIINCYNGEAYLKKCIESILRQTYNKWELIFWDNKSNDSSKKIFLSFKDKRLKYFLTKKFTNLYAARNMALKKISGDIIMFIDTDDEWLPNKIMEQLKIFKRKKVDIVCTNFFREKYFLFKLKLTKISKRPSQLISINDNLKNYIIGWSTIAIKKKVFNLKIKNFNEKLFMISDYEFIMNHSLNKKIYYINKPLVLYKEHPNQLSRKLFFDQINQFIIWYDNFARKKKISGSKNFKYLQKRYNFLKSIKEVRDKNNFSEVLDVITKLDGIKSKIKILFFYVLPKIYISYYTST